MSPLRRHDTRLRPARTEEIKRLWDERWYGLVVSTDTVYHPDDVEGLALVDSRDEILGLATLHIDGVSGQIVTLDTMVRGRGFGRWLLEACESHLHQRGIGRAWAVMTNDNLLAVSLYLSRGYRLVRIHLDAVKRVREFKPQLPDRGYEGMPIRDLWELEKIGLIGVPVP